MAEHPASNTPQAEGPQPATRRGGLGHRKQALKLLLITGSAALFTAAILLIYHLKRGHPGDEPAPLALAALLVLAPFAVTLPVVLVLLIYGALADRRGASRPKA